MRVEEHTQSVSEALTQAYPVIGWVVGLAMAVWSYILKLAIGQHIKAREADQKDRAETRSFMASIDVRLSRIEGRFDERDHGGR